MGFGIAASMEEEFCTSGKLKPFIVEAPMVDKSAARKEGVSKT